MSGIPVVSEILSTLLSNPLMAWLSIITAISLDTWLSSSISFKGVVGEVATQAIRFLTGNYVIEVTSFQILVLIVIFPLVIYALQKSATPKR